MRLPTRFVTTLQWTLLTICVHFFRIWFLPQEKKCNNKTSCFCNPTWTPNHFFDFIKTRRVSFFLGEYPLLHGYLTCIILWFHWIMSLVQNWYRNLLRFGQRWDDAERGMGLPRLVVIRHHCFLNSYKKFCCKEVYVHVEGSLVSTRVRNCKALPRNWARTLI